MFLVSRGNTVTAYKADKWKQNVPCRLLIIFLTGRAESVGKSMEKHYWAVDYEEMVPVNVDKMILSCKLINVG